MMVEKKREELAIYEAGRAIVACALGISFERASIASDISGVGLTRPADEPWTAERLKEAIIVGLAGAAAEAMRSTHGPSAVQVLAEEYAAIVPHVDTLLAMSETRDVPGARELLVLSLWEQVLKLLNTHWASVALLADLLLELGTVGYDEVVELYEHTTMWHARS